jgi:hypothetical protein
MTIKSILLVSALAVGLVCPVTSLATDYFAVTIDREPPDAGAYHVIPAMEAFPSGTRVEVQAVAFPGYRFVRWEGDIAATESALSFEVTADTSLTAVFEWVGVETAAYEVRVVAEPQVGGSITRDPVKASYLPGDVVTFTAIAAEGYVFAGWTGDVPEEAEVASAELSLTVDDDLELTAVFEVAAGVTPDTLENPLRGTACGALGMLFWPMTLLGLVALRRR